MTKLRRGFIVTWLVLGLAGALNHTIADRVFGGTVDLKLPHLQYGYVMFNQNPTRVPVFTFARGDGERRDLSDLDPRPAPGYARARATVDATLAPTYLRDLCNRALRSADDEITIHIDGYDVLVDNQNPAISSTVKCDVKPR
ncbi:MAG TPA: hypothetical protein VIV11_38355 [Kofleriaceae bacterium]